MARNALIFASIARVRIAEPGVNPEMLIENVSGFGFGVGVAEGVGLGLTVAGGVGVTEGAGLTGSCCCGAGAGVDCGACHFANRMVSFESETFTAAAEKRVPVPSGWVAHPLNV